MADQTDWLTVRIRLADAAAFKLETAGAAAAVKGMGDATEVAGKKSAFAAEKNFILGESMYSLRRYAFWGITAIGLTGAAAVKMGYDFDKAKTEGIDALTAITGGAGNARREVSALIGLTHNTGLGLDVLTGATKNMLTFGFSVRDTNRYLRDFGNFAQAKGTGAAGLTDIVGIVDRIKNTGMLTSRDLRSLTGLGVPGKFLSSILSPDQITLLQRGGGTVRADAAIPALAAWMGQYAARQPKTIDQQWGRVKSYLAQISGTASRPAFDWLAGSALPAVLSRLQGATAHGGGFTGMLTGLDPSRNLTHAWQTLTGALRLFGDTLRSIWTVARPFVGVLLLASSALLAVTSHSRALKLILEPLIALYIVHRAVLLLDLATTKLLVLWTKAWTAANVLYTLWVLRAEYAQLLFAKAAKIGAAAQWLFNIALDANPVGIYALAIAGLAVGFYELYTRSAWFRANWPKLIDIAFPFLGATVLIIQSITTVWDMLKRLYNWLDNHVFTIHFGGGGLLHDIGSVAGIATGLPVNQLAKEGKSLVSRVNASGGGDQTYYDRLGKAVAKALHESPIRTTVNIDGKKAAESVAQGKAALAAAT